MISIQGQYLFKGDIYSREVSIQGQYLFKAASIQGRYLFKGGWYLDHLQWHCQEFRKSKQEKRLHTKKQKPLQSGNIFVAPQQITNLTSQFFLSSIKTANVFKF